MRTSRMPATLRRLLFSHRGTAAVEFALVGPLFFAFLLGTVEVCLIMFINIGIEAAVREGARYGITGNAPSGMTRQQQLEAIISQRTMGLVDDTIQVSTKVYPTFTAIGNPEPYTDTNGNGKWDPGEPFTDLNGNASWDQDPGVAGMGGAGEIVLYTITYGVPLIAPLTEKLFDYRLLTIDTRIVVRNEPWNPA